MTRILVLSDTHLPSRPRRSFGSKEFPGGIQDLFDDLSDYVRKADLILHAGDHTEIAFYDALQTLGRVRAVHGNMDVPELRVSLPERAVIDCEKLRIGMIHGWGASEDLPERMLRAWPGPRPHVIVFGHSHEPYQGYREGVLLFNPGSPTSPRGRKATAGWLEIDGERCMPGFIRLR